MSSKFPFIDLTVRTMVLVAVFTGIWIESWKLYAVTGAATASYTVNRIYEKDKFGVITYSFISVTQIILAIIHGHY